MRKAKNSNASLVPQGSLSLAQHEIQAEVDNYSQLLKGKYKEFTLNRVFIKEERARSVE